MIMGLGGCVCGCANLCHVFFIDSSIPGHLACLPILAIVTNAENMLGFCFSNVRLFIYFERTSARISRGGAESEEGENPKQAPHCQHGF